MKQHYTQIINAIDKYSIGDFPYTIVNLMALSNKDRYFVMNVGKAGTSKSWISSDLARYLKFASNDVDENNFSTDPVHVYNGKLTDKGFFDHIKAMKQKIVVLDDITALSVDVKNIIKDLCGSSNFTAWTKNNEHDSFKFEGSLIMNANRDSKDADLEAVKSRAFVCNFTMNPVQMKQKGDMFLQMAKKNITNPLKFNQATEDIWRLIRNRMLDMTMLKLNNKEIDIIREWCDNITIHHSTNISMRDNVLMIKFFEWWKSFWGTLDDTLFKKGFEIISYFYADGQGKKKSDVYQTAIEYLETHKCQTIRRQDFVFELMSKYGYKKSTAQQNITNALLAGDLQLGMTQNILQIPLPKNYIVKTIVKSF